MKRYWKLITTIIMTAALVFAPAAGMVYATDTLASDDLSSDTDTDTDITPSDTATPSRSSGSGAFITIGDTYQTQTVSAGQNVTLVIPIVNYAYFPVTDLVITPHVTNLASSWPFMPSSTGYTKQVPYLSAYADGVDVNAQRADVTYNFTVRQDAYTGYYPLVFDLSYIINDGIESTSVTCYIYVKGAAGSGNLEQQTKTSTSKPRLIVTGFETDPAQVMAGETFTVTVHVQNTAANTQIRNALFNLQADVETTGTGKDATSYAAFLPTSGSSSIYKDKIGAGEIVDLSIEMQSRADLTEKPYVLDVKMTYDAGNNADLSDTASVSIPIYQESKFDTGEEEISNSFCAVGEENAVSFSIYNTGRTTLNNVWFRFRDDNVDGSDVFVGTIESGSTGYVDASFIANAPNDGIVKGVIEYEGDAGNVTTVEKEFEISISDMADYGMEDFGDMDDMVDEKPAVNKGLIIGIVIAAAAVAAVIIVLVVLRQRKKKKEEAFLADDLEDLTDETGNEDNEGK